jgi:hypothetical protein
LCIHGCIVPPILISYFLNFLSSLLLSFPMNKFELKVTVLWDVVSCSLLGKCHYLRETYLAALSASLLWWWRQQVPLKHWYVCTTTWCFTPENTDLHSHCCKNCTFLCHSDFVSSCRLFAVRKWYSCHCVTDGLHFNNLCLFILKW